MAKAAAMLEMTEEQLRDKIFAAVRKGPEDPTLVELCRKYKDLILECYPRWKSVPAEADPKLYGQALSSLAQYFAAQLKDGRLMQTLLGVGDVNPLGAWESDLQTVREMLLRLDLLDAAQKLVRLLERNASQQGAKADQLRAESYGLLGEARFAAGAMETAREALMKALEMSRQQGDKAAVIRHLGTFYDLERFVGDREAAHARAIELTELDPDKADVWKTRAARALNCPPVRLVAEAGGKEYELDEVPPHLRPAVIFHFRRDRTCVRLAQFYMQAGRQLAAQTYHAKAHECFVKAGQLDPYDPDPRALAGKALIALGRFPEAVTAYEEADRLAPGWFRVSSELWLARELAENRVPLPAWHALQQMEGGGPGPDEVVLFATNILMLLPNFAPLHFYHGQALEHLGQAEAAERAFRLAVEHAAEPNLKTRALLQLGLLVQEPERTQRLREAAALNGHLPAAARARWLL